MIRQEGDFWIMVGREEYSRFERARVISARALQLSMGAPPLIKRTVLAADPIAMARAEFEKGVIPITVARD